MPEVAVTPSSKPSRQSRPEIERRRALTHEKRRLLSVFASEAFDPIGSISDRAFVYITGSMARDEATEDSDLDLFVIDELDAGDTPLDYVDTAHLVSRLDLTRSKAGFRPFSRGGQFVRTLSLQDIVSLIGDPQDDARNAFTARILLLVNSKPLINESAYRSARTVILDRYWDPDNLDGLFHPIMLLNDLRRWWGVVCLNFEQYNPHSGQQATPQQKAERRIANLKLRHARVLAAYSPILRLVAGSEPDGRVSRAKADDLLAETPVTRIEMLEQDTGLSDEARRLASAVLAGYEDYLVFMRKDKKELEAAVIDQAVWLPTRAAAYKFHETLVQLSLELGQDKPLFDYMLI